MLKKTNITASLLLFHLILLTLLIIFRPTPLSAQINAAELFDDNCADCHSIGEGDMLGPDLIGVTYKHKKEWLIQFIKSSKTVINSGDPLAVAIYEKFKKKKMPDNDLSMEEIKALIDYINSFSKSTTIETKETTTSTEEKLESKDTEVTEDVVTDVEAKLDVIEKKLDLLLEFQKQSLSTKITDEELEAGRLLFLGLKNFDKGGASCVSCHNVEVTDSINWNPSAEDLSFYSLDKSNQELLTKLNNPAAGLMKTVHKDYQISFAELTYIKGFLQEFGKTGLKEMKPPLKKLIIFLILGLLIVLAIIDLYWIHLLKYRIVHYSIICIGLVFISKIIYDEAYALGYSPGYAPDQPIKFSHKIHADQNQIDCQYCHCSAEISRAAGFPSVGVCMNCHNKIKSGLLTGQFEINKIRKHYKDKEPIEWIKIHNLPDHVFFSHSQHVNAGKIECNRCHGKVEEMHRLEQTEELSMGWCLECHRTTKVQFENNEYYAMFEKLHKELKEGKIDRVSVADIGGNECQRCHY